MLLSLQFIPKFVPSVQHISHCSDRTTFATHRDFPMNLASVTLLIFKIHPALRLNSFPDLTMVQTTLYVSCWVIFPQHPSSFPIFPLIFTDQHHHNILHQVRHPQYRHSGNLDKTLYSAVLLGLLFESFTKARHQQTATLRFRSPKIKPEVYGPY